MSEFTSTYKFIKFCQVIKCKKQPIISQLQIDLIVYEQEIIIVLHDCLRLSTFTQKPVYGKNRTLPENLRRFPFLFESAFELRAD